MICIECCTKVLEVCVLPNDVVNRLEAALDSVCWHVLSKRKDRSLDLRFDSVVHVYGRDLQRDGGEQGRTGGELEGGVEAFDFVESVTDTLDDRRCVLVEGEVLRAEVDGVHSSDIRVMRGANNVVGVVNRARDLEPCM